MRYSNILRISFALIIISKTIYAESIYLNGIRYHIHGKIDHRYIYEFNEIFHDSITQTFFELNTLKPNHFTIYLSENSEKFARLTGKNWFVAGVYEPRKESYYFQNPKFLFRQGGIHQIIKHEMCHQALFIVRPDISYFSPVLDESFCESYSPTKNMKIELSRDDLLFLQKLNFESWKSAMEKDMKSNQIITAERAYRMIRHCGNYFMKNLGRSNFFQQVSINSHDGINQIFDLYKKHTTTSLQNIIKN